MNFRLLQVHYWIFDPRMVGPCLTLAHQGARGTQAAEVAPQQYSESSIVYSLYFGKIYLQVCFVRILYGIYIL